MKKSVLKKSKLTSYEKIIIVISLICLIVLLAYKLILSVPKQQKIITYTVQKDVSASSAYAVGSSAAQSSSLEPTSEHININTAGVTELARLPLIGEVKASAIVEYRNKNGPFASIEDIKNVNGIGDKTFERIKDAITVG